MMKILNAPALPVATHPSFIKDNPAEALLSLFMKQKDIQPDLPQTNHKIRVFQDKATGMAMAMVTKDKEAPLLFVLNTQGDIRAFQKIDNDSALPDSLKTIFHLVDQGEKLERRFMLRFARSLGTDRLQDGRYLNSLQRQIDENKAAQDETAPLYNRATMSVIYGA